MTKIVIIGAGATGLSAAYHLEQKGFYDYQIFEKDATTGGLCRSVVQDGFTFDYTGHLLHINDEYFRQFMQTVAGLENFVRIDRRSFVYSQDRYTRYPYQVNLYGLPPQTITECIEGFVNRPRTNKKPKNFKEWVVQNFGEGFGKYFFFSYQAKIFAYDITKISARWTGRFVPSTTLKHMLMGALQDNVQEKIGYNATFLYPKRDGISFWVDKLAHTLRTPIATDMEVTKIDAKNKVVHFANGHIQSYDTLISTMPLNVLLKKLTEPSNSTLKRAVPKLKCNEVVNFNLGVNRPDLSEKHWIYFPEKKYPFYRIGFPHNFTDSMAPPGCSSLYGEFSHVGASPKTVEKMLAASLASTKKVLNISDRDVVTQKIIRIPHAYVIYDHWRDRNLPKLHQHLELLHIHSIGRYGEWKYSSMQEAVLDGKAIADKLVIKPAQQAYDVPVARHPEKHKEW